MSVPILVGKPKTERVMVEVCRSFSFKLNLAKYQSADFFASRKMQCDQEAAAFISQQIFEECVDEVRKAITQFRKSWEAKERREMQEIAERNRQRESTVQDR